MSIPSNRFDRIEPEPTANGNDIEPARGYKIIPLLEPTVRRDRNFFYSPFVFFKESAFYQLAVMLLRIFSGSTIVFLRKRMGLRMLPVWAFTVMFIALAGGGLFLQDGALFLYALAMAALAFYHIQVAYELSDKPVGKRLHSLATGDSHLTALFAGLANEGGWCITLLPMFSELPHRWRFKTTKLIPFDEPFVQRWIEPLLVILLGLLVWIHLHSFFLSAWLLLTAGGIAVVERERGDVAFHNDHDGRDTEVEAYGKRVVREDDKSAVRQNPSKKIGGIARADYRIIEMRERLRMEGEET